MRSRRRSSTGLFPAPYVPIPTEESVFDDVHDVLEALPGELSCTLDDTPLTCWEWSESLLDRPAYQVSSAVLIAINAIVVGMETDFPDWPGWNPIENTFLALFSLELALRLVLITPRKFFRVRNNPEICWNLFDFVIVSFGLVDFLGTLLTTPSKGGMQVALVFRIVRLCRILRILRIIRFLRQLYLLAYGFVEATLAIFWVTMLMTCVLYVCGIILVRLYGRVPADDPDHDFLTTHFGTVPGSMLSLFELMSQPDLVLYQEVLHNRPSLLPFLICFIIFGSFGMIALLTGVISESMFEKNKARIEEAHMEREQKRTRIQKNTRKLFDSMQADESGTVTKEELFNFLARQPVPAPAPAPATAPSAQV